MAILSRSSVIFVKEETVEGTLQALTAGSEAISLREGFAVTSEPESIESDELKGDKGGAKPIVVGENPTFEYPGYTRASGTAGSESEVGVIIESCMGDKTIASTEYDTVAGSTVSVINVDSGEGANFEIGQQILVKDLVNGYSVRNVQSIATDALTLNFDLPGAPAAGVSLGKAILYKSGNSNPTFSMYRFQAATSSAFKDAIAGCRTNSLSFEFPARDLASMTASVEGLNFYYNYITIDATNNKIDFTDTSSTVVATLANKVYASPIDLATEITNKMTAASVDAITCTYSSSTGKFTIVSDGSTLSLLWSSGSNTAASVDNTIGFPTTDGTGALTYTSGVQTYNAPFTPSYDDQDPIVVKNAELLIGGNDDITSRKATNVSITIGTPVQKINSVAAENGTEEAINLERNAKLTATIILPKYEAEIFHRSINNTETRVMMNIGPKDGAGNWTPAKVCNFFMQSATITGAAVQDENGYQVISLTAKGYVGSLTKDIFLGHI